MCKGDASFVVAEMLVLCDLLCHACTVEPPNNGHLGEMAFVPCRDAVPISEASLPFPLFHH